VAPPTIEALVDRVLADERGAWQDLWQEVEPRLLALVRRPRFLGKISESEDDCRNVVVDVLAALRAHDHARLRSYVAARAENPALPFFAWLTVVAKRLAIDYMRRMERYQDLRGRQGAGAKGAWTEVTTLLPESHVGSFRPPVTNRATVAELLRYASRDLPAEQCAALSSWIQGGSFEDIARDAGLAGPRQAERVLRAALERLRRRFREEPM
jgi:DNA-directed RNA polymerase specialized sigma24 family protein